jgi:hypothetical protein
MTPTSVTRSVSAVLAAVALGLCAPAAGAKPIDTGPAASFIVASSPPTLVSSPSAAWPPLRCVRQIAASGYTGQ